MATQNKKSRQSRSLSTLESQLKQGSKTEKKSFDKKVPLTDTDKRRIEKEISILKTKV